MKRVEIESLLDFRFVSAPSFSPCGRYAAFVLQQADVEKNGYVGDLWLLDTETKQTRRLTAAGDARSYTWTKQGKLLFAAMRDSALKAKVQKGEQLSCFYEIDPCGGEAQLAFTLPLFAGRAEAIDEERFVVMATYDNARPDLDAMDETQREAALKKLASPAYEVLEEAPFWFNGAGFTAGKRSRLYIYNRASGELNAVTAPWFDCSGYVLQGEQLLYKGDEWQGMRKANGFGSASVRLYNIATGEDRELLPQGKVFSGAMAFWDEKTAVIAASYGENYGDNEYLDFYNLNLATGELSLLCDYEASIGGNSVGSDARLGGGRSCKVVGDRFWFLTTVEEHGYLRYVDRAGKLSEFVTPDGSCDSFDVFGDKVLTCGLYGDKLAELYLCGEQVTDFNGAWLAEHSVCTPEFHSFTATDGFEIHGYAMKPAGYEAGKKYPAILHIHGGPRTVFGSVFHHEMQVWANAGYFVFYCNPRGSDGRGDAFGDINGKYGTVDYENIMQFTDEMLQKYPDVDRFRVGVTGGSYGGFMTNWIIGHTGRFAAAASQRSIANWIAFEHTSDIGPFFTPNNQATNTRENVEKMWWHSPLKYADNCTTPTLFIHSDNDYRCWMVEGLSMFTALKMHGCEARMCLFKGETHELSRSGKPQNRIRRMEEILGWMDKYLKR